MSNSDEIKEIPVEEYIESNSSTNEPTKKSKLRILFDRNKFWLISFIIITICYGAFSIGKKYYMEYRSTMPTSHVYVCDNPKHDSDFDAWLKETVDVNWVPTYVIIKNQTVIGSFPGDIDKEEFSTKVALCANFNAEVAKLPDLEISNINDERKSLKEIFSGDATYILEVHWFDCEDCEHQDQYFSKEIYSKYSTSNFYRYYIKSEKDDVSAKYSE